MALDLLAITYRSPRRIRLSFSSALAAGAYTTAPYTVTNLDADGGDPAVQAALLVPNSPEVVELALSIDLASASLYQVTCTAVPDLEPATFTGTFPFSTPGARVVPSTAVQPDDVEAELYGSDLVWDGQDLIEEANGDLARVSGLANVEAALPRAIASEGLAWRPDYGGKLRRYVDAPIPGLTPARASVQRCLLTDDRVRSARVVATDRDNTGVADIDAEVKLIGNRVLRVEDVLPTR